MWRGKVELQSKARKLRLQGRSLNEISQLLRVAKSSVSVWVRAVPLTQRQRRHLKEKELKGGAKGRRKLPTYWETYRKLHPRRVKIGPRWPKREVENFFDTWTPEMAYVLGYFAADGCMYKNKRGSYYIGFVSTDQELIEIVKRLMGVSNTVEEYQSPKPNHKRRYTLQIGSRKMFQQLIDLGFTPAKSLVVTLPAVPDALLGHFARGYLDGDGCVYTGTYYDSSKKRYLSAFSVRFTSGSRSILKALQIRLKNMAGIGKGSLVTRTSSHFVLSYSARDARHLYGFMYPSNVPCLKRKKEKFEQGIKQMGPVV